MSTKNKKGFTMPNNYVVIFGIIVLAIACQLMFGNLVKIFQIAFAG